MGSLILEIHRLVDAPKDLQLGVMKINGIPCYTTCELPYKDNEPDVSGIRGGEYKIVKYFSPHFQKKLWRLVDVEDREDIEIHPLQFPSETRGCIGVGIGFGQVEGFHTITETVRAFRNLMFQTETYEIGSLYIWDE